MHPYAARFGRALFGAGAALLLTIFAHAPARAAEKAPPDTTKPVMFLKETVVTGSRFPRAFYESPQALSFVNRTQIREQMPTVSGDLLQQLPGVDNSKDSPWEQRPVIRGLSGQRVLVLMDGQSVNSARGNGPHPSLIHPSQIERIEVLRGPSSVAYGSDALGGVINMITRQAPELADGEASSLHGGALVGGSSSDRGYKGSVYLTPRFGKFSAFVSSAMTNAENFRTPDHGRTPQSGFNDYNALANLRYQWTDRTALKGGWQLYRGHDIGLPGLAFSETGFEQFFKFPYYRRDEANLAVEHAYGASSWFSASSAKVYWQSEGRDFYSHMGIANDFVFGPGTPGTFVDNTDRYLKLNTAGIQIQTTSKRTERYQMTFGLDAKRDVTDGTNLDVVSDELFPTSSTVSRSLPTGRFDDYAGFVQSDWTLAPRWNLDLGGRYTHYRDRSDFGVASPASNGGGGPQPEVDFQPTRVDHDALAGTIGLVFAPTEDLHLTANVANGYRQPNAQDLFFDGPASVGIVLGNAKLKPETGVSSDIGLRWGPGHLAFSGNLFYSTYQDLIDAIEVAAPAGPGAPATYQYVNISNARIWGGEAEGEWRFLDRWTARATVTGAVGDITSRSAIETLYQVDADRAPLPNVPPFKGSASVRWTSPGGRLWVEPGMRYSWRTNRLPLPTANVEQITDFKKEWIVGDVLAGYRLGEGQRVEVGVRNFTDRAYRLPLGSLEEPGISFVGSLSTTF